jgi:multiple antibiotic resistance protein
MLEYTEYTKMLIGLIAIVNPIGAIPIFISLTSNLETSERNAISRTVVYSVLVRVLKQFPGQLLKRAAVFQSLCKLTIKLKNG